MPAGPRRQRWPREAWAASGCTGPVWPAPAWPRNSSKAPTGQPDDWPKRDHPSCSGQLRACLGWAWLLLPHHRRLCHTRGGGGGILGGCGGGRRVVWGQKESQSEAPLCSCLLCTPIPPTSRPPHSPHSPHPHPGLREGGENNGPQSALLWGRGDAWREGVSPPLVPLLFPLALSKGVGVRGGKSTCPPSLHSLQGAPSLIRYN